MKKSWVRIVPLEPEYEQGESAVWEAREAHDRYNGTLEQDFPDLERQSEQFYNPPGRCVSMGVKYLLDTSVYSQVLKRMPEPEIVRRWKAVGDAAGCISVFCELEVLQGLEMAAGRSKPGSYRRGTVGRTFRPRGPADDPGDLTNS